MAVSKTALSGKDSAGVSNPKGLIFHIIHSSFVDGYGIRTTVFLKGCPLRCLWCCNPEGQAVHPELKLTAESCDGCGRCLAVCAPKAIRLDDKTGGERITVDRRLCTNCFACLDVCFTGALDRFGKYYTVDELFRIVRQDEPFYRSSGGGVTIGGGEPTFQPEFVRAFLKKCRENYIHTALDTCLYTVNPEGVKALEEADLLLVDVKGLAMEAHRQDTGVSNEVILANLKQLSAIGKPIIIRLPLIPGHTDGLENIIATAEFLSGLKSVERIDLLNYHEYGIIKYRQLGKQYRLDIRPLSEERVGEIKSTLELYGLKVQLGG